MTDILSWAFTMFLVLGSGSGDLHGRVVLPTVQLCEATREAVMGLPQVGRGKLVAGPCARRTSDEPESIPIPVTADAIS